MTSTTTPMARSTLRNSYRNERNKNGRPISFHSINSMKRMSYSAEDLDSKFVTDEFNNTAPLTIISLNHSHTYNKKQHQHHSKLKPVIPHHNQNDIPSSTSTENGNETQEVIIVSKEVTTESDLKRQGSFRPVTVSQPSSYYENVRLDKALTQEQQTSTTCKTNLSDDEEVGDNDDDDDDDTSNSSNISCGNDDNELDSSFTDEDSINTTTNHCVLIYGRERAGIGRRLSLPHALSATDDSLSGNSQLSYHTCLICYEDKPLRPLAQCCQSPVCSECLQFFIEIRVNEAQIKIPCPIKECTYIMTREEILNYLDQNQELKEKYKRFYADINKEINIKTCPKCCSILELDKKLFTSPKHRPRRVECLECSFVWCFQCHSPWHEKMTCKEYTEGNKLLKQWANQYDQNQSNAKQCPKCKVFISRNGGCPHMTCSKCSCDFCYNCGKRRLEIKFFGTHESKYLPLGCKYNLYPNKPVLRKTLRGLFVGAAVVVAPVAAVGAVALLAVGTTVAVPTYGTYRLVKFLRQRHQRRSNIQLTERNNDHRRRSSWNGDSDQESGPSTIETREERELRLAIAASEQTFEKEEYERKAIVFDDNDSLNYGEMNWKTRASLDSLSTVDGEEQNSRSRQRSPLPSRKSLLKLTPTTVTDNKF